MNIAMVLLSLCLQMGVDEQSCPTLMEGTDYPTILRLGDIMVYVATKSDDHYILYSEKSIKKLSEKEVSQVLVHELTHYIMYAEDGVNTHQHKSSFRKKCKALSIQVNVSNKSCGK